MNVGLFGGTFDPIHHGHIAVAQAARQQLGLRLIYFAPTGIPPHKPDAAITAFEHRYAMVALATAEEKEFVPCLIEAPRPTNLLQFSSPANAASNQKAQPAAPNYSISTVRRMRTQLNANDKLYFIVGIDAFLQIRTWREPEALLEEVEFIIAARPGFSLADVAAALPESLQPSPQAMKPFRKQKPAGTLALPGATLHLLPAVNVDVSSTAIRKAAAGKGDLARYVGRGVAAYIRKQKLYKSK